VAVAADHDGDALGHSRVALAQRDAGVLGEADQLLERPVRQPGVGRMRDRLGLHRGVDDDPLEILGLQAPILCAADRLSWISATSCSSPRRWRQRVNDERSNGAACWKVSSPQKNW
jgi:hypothetical protein